MPAIRETPQPQLQVIHRVGGMTVRRWGGMSVEDAPHLIADNDFQWLQNVRKRGAYLVPRQGFVITPDGPGDEATDPDPDAALLYGVCSGYPYHTGMGGLAFEGARDYDNTSDTAVYGVSFQLVTTQNAGQTDGKIWVDARTMGTATGNHWREVTKNNVTDWVYRVGLGGRAYRPSFVYTGPFRVLMAGQWEAPIVIRCDNPSVATPNNAYLAGVTADSVGTAQVAAGAGTGITGTVDAAYVTWAEIDPLTSVVLSESNPVAVSGTPLTLTNQDISWTNLPTSHSNAKVTHKRLWRGMDGGLPRFVASVTLATGSYTDSVSTATLATREALPNDGSNIFFKRDVPPNARFVVFYHGRVWYGGDPAFPQRIFFSDIVDYPTNLSGWEGVAGYRDTLEYESVTGMVVRGDQLLIFCKHCTYEIQGWSAGNEGVAADITIRKIHPSIGCLSHHLALNVNGRIWFWGEDGPWIYDGSFSYIGQKVRGYFFDRSSPENSLLWQEEFRETAFMVNDPMHRAIITYNSGDVGETNVLAYVAHYADADPTLGGEVGPPDWSVDVYGYAVTGGGMLREGLTNDNARLYIGLLAAGGAVDFCKSQGNLTPVVDSAGATTFQHVRIIIGTRHEVPRGPGGMIDEGCKFRHLWSYFRNPATTETETVDIYVFSGDESVYEDANDTSAAALKREHTDTAAGTIHAYRDPFAPNPDQDYEATLPAASVFKDGLDVASGRGITIEYDFPVVSPEWRWYGYSIWHLPGKAYMAPVVNQEVGF